MKKIKNKILKTLEIINTILCALAICCLDSVDNTIPIIVLIVTLTYLFLFDYVNGGLE